MASPLPSAPVLGGLSVLMLVSACSGAASSDLLVAPAAATSEPTSSVPTRDAGTGASPSVDSGSSALASAGDAAGLGAVDSAATPEAGADDASGVTDAATNAIDSEDAADVTSAAEAGPSPFSCPLPGEAASTIDDGSWSASNATILPQCGRMGAWYVMNDGASTQSPLAGGPFGPFLTSTPPSSAKGYVRTWGTLAPVSTETHDDPHWGAEIGFELDTTAGVPQPYDLAASGYTGFTFWVRTGTANQLTPIWFDVPTRDTISYTDGAFHSFAFAAPAPGVWTEITVPFTNLTQPSWTPAGEQVAFDPTAAISVQWNFDSAATASLAYDVSVGDVELW